MLLLHDIRSNEPLNASTVTDAISRYIIDLSEALDLELMASASRGQTDFTSLCAMDKLTFVALFLLSFVIPISSWLPGTIILYLRYSIRLTSATAH